MYMFTIEGDGLDDAGKRGVLDWIVRPALRTVPGVADVNALGGRVRSFDVVPDRIAMAAAGVSVQSLADALAANNANDGAGRLDEGEEALVVRTTGALQGLQDIAAVQVVGAAGQRLRVDQIAVVREGSLTRYGAVTRSGKGEAVQGLVIGLRGADAGAVVQGVKARLAELQAQLPPGVRIVPFYDRSDLIQRATGTKMPCWKPRFSWFCCWWCFWVTCVPPSWWP